MTMPQFTRLSGPHHPGEAGNHEGGRIMTSLPTKSRFKDPNSMYRSVGDTFRPAGSILTFEADADYQLLKLILVTNGERKTLCVMDWKTAYNFFSNVTIATVSAVCQDQEADAIAEAEISETTS